MVRVRPIRQEDFAWLKSYDCTPLHVERDSIYLFFCVHFDKTSFVAEDVQDGEPVGFLLGFVPAGCGTAYVHYLFVAAARRHQGIGSELMKRFIDAARESGARAVTLYTIRAAAFYEKLGFEARASRFGSAVAEYIRTEKGAVIMTRGLA